MAKGAVPSEAGSRSAKTRSVAPGRDPGVLVHAVGPDDLLGRGHAARVLRIGPPDLRRARGRLAEFPPSDGEDAAAAADLLFLGRERNRRVALLLRLVGQRAGRRVEGKAVAVLRVGDRFGRLHDVETQVERVPAEDVAHVGAADDDELEPGFFGDALQSRRAHLARRADGEAIAGDQERLAAVHALRGSPASGSGTRRPSSARPAYSRLSDTQSAAGVIWSVSIASSFLPGVLGVPDDESLAPDGRPGSACGRVGRPGTRQVFELHSRLKPRFFNGMQTAPLGRSSSVRPRQDPSSTGSRRPALRPAESDEKKSSHPEPKWNNRYSFLSNRSGYRAFFFSAKGELPWVVTLPRKRSRSRNGRRPPIVRKSRSKWFRKQRVSGRDSRLL